MWQCVPVKKIVARIATTLLVAAYIQPFTQAPAAAQANIGYNQVVSSKVSKSNGSVTLFTQKRTQLPRPIIRFLPGEYGDTILVADFPGVIYKPATKVIQVNSSFANRFATKFGTTKKGIKLVRIGRFQDSPPVLRIAIIANDVKRLKSVSFNSKPGNLTVSWSKWLKTEKTPGLAPSYKKKENPVQTATSPPFAPPIGSLDANTVSKANQIALRPPIGMKAPPAQSISKPAKKTGILSRFINKVKGKYSKPLEPQVDSSQVSKYKPATNSQIEDDKKAKAQQNSSAKPIITATKTGKDSYSIQVRNIGAKAPTIKSFQLSNPPRYVVDIQNLKELASASVPSISPTKYLNGLRVGNPVINGNDSTGRLVFDLASPGVSVDVLKDDLVDSGTIAITVGKADDLLAGLKAPKGTTVVLDAGHGGDDPGAQRGHLNEKDITLSITNKTYKHLKSKGVNCILTRHKDETVSLQDRVKITNTKKPDLFLSIHVNALETKSNIHGIETYYQTPQSLAFAKTIHKSLVTELKAPDRRVRKARFYVVNRTQIPAVLAEVGFISHKEERKKLVTQSYQNEIALALAKGVITHLNQTTMIAKSEKDAKNLSNKSVTSASKLSKTQGQTQSKRGTISRVSRLAQKGLGINVK